MTQPDWQLVYATDYSALYTDRTGVYDPELAILEDRNSRSGTFDVYRTPLKGLALVKVPDGRWIVTDDGYEPTHPYPASMYRPWFWDDLPDVARSVGRSTLAIVRDLMSGDARRLAHAYEDIAGYHGWDNFDQYPDRWYASEAQDWPDRGPMRVSLACSDDDDGSVTVYCEDKARAKHEQSISLDGQSAQWECPGDMDTAYASLCNFYDLATALTAAGYDVDDSEYTPPDAEDLAYWSYRQQAEQAGERPLDREEWLESPRTR